MADLALVRRVSRSTEDMEIPGSEERKILSDNARELFAFARIPCGLLQR
jgi:hypothetical protein